METANAVQFNMSVRIIIKNKKARFNYEILEKFEAGIALAGTEVKSIRAGKVKIEEAFCNITADYQLELLQMSISPYEFGNIHNHDATRRRRLLMHRREIIRLNSKIKEKGLTLIPVALYFKKDKVKVELGLGRGKKLHDKREILKKRDQKLEIDRAIKNTN